MTNKLDELVYLLNAEKEYKGTHELEYAWPRLHREQCPKHMEFIEATKNHRVCVLLACNRAGKSYLLSYTVACHALGYYPDWWTGKQFKRCSHIMVMGANYDQLRLALQKYLIGSFDDPGTGFIPKDSLLIDKCRTVHGVSNVFKLLKVQRLDGTVCTIEFGSTDAGSQRLAGAQFNLVIIDEPTTLDIYAELLMRTTVVDNGDPNDRQGQVLLNFTAVDGWIPLLDHFLPNKTIPKSGVGPQGEYISQIQLEDVPEFILTDEMKEGMIRTTPPHQLAARTTGIPSIGASAVYPVPIDVWTCKSFKIPGWWPRAYAVDPGIKNVGAIFATQNPETGQIYIYDEYQTYASDATSNLSQLIGITCMQIRTRLLGDWMLGMADPNSIKQLVGDGGLRLLNIYRENGLHLMRPETTNREAGIAIVLEWLSAGKIQVFMDRCPVLVREIAQYSRDEKGDPVRRNDHEVDALRYLCIGANRIFRLNPELEDERVESEIDYSRNKITGY